MIVCHLFCCLVPDADFRVSVCHCYGTLEIIVIIVIVKYHYHRH